MEIMDNIRKYYLYQFLVGLSFIEAIFYLFLQSNNLSYFQITFLLSWAALMTMLFKIPAGIVSDTLGRRKALLIGSFAAVLNSVIYAVSSDFFLFLIAETLWGAFIAFGDASSFVYDSLGNIKKGHSKRIFSHGTFYMMLGGVVAPTVGSIVASLFGLRATMAIAIIPTIIYSYVVLSSLEPLKARKTSIKIFGHIKESANIILKNRMILFMATISIALSLPFFLMGAFIQPYMVKTGISVFWLGFVFSGVNLLTAVLCRESHRIENLLGFRRTIIITTLLPMIGFLILGLLFNPILTILAFFMISSSKRLTDPVLLHYQNKMVKTKVRATVASIINLVYFVLFAILSPLAGYFSDSYGIIAIMTVFSISSFFLFVFTVFGTCLLDKKITNMLKL